MSTYNDIDIICEKCGREFRAVICVALHAQENPELKDLLLGGGLNLAVCPACSHAAFQEHFLLYQDPVGELAAYVYPHDRSHESESLRAAMTQGFREVQEAIPPAKRRRYDPVLLFGIESLLDLLHDDDETIQQSTIAEAYCRQSGIPYRRVPPAQARRARIPRILPLGSAVKNQSYVACENLAAGLERLLAINPVLSLYAALRDQLAADPTSYDAVLAG